MYRAVFKSCLLAVAFLGFACGQASQSLEIGSSSQLSSSTSYSYESYVRTVEGVELKITAPKRSEIRQPIQLALYLHGDTANDHNNNWFEPLRQFSMENGLLFVSARSPNAYSWWSDDVQSFAFYQNNLDQAISWLREYYPINDQKYLFSGVSGGSTFLSSVFIPNLGNQYPGIYAMMCGGARIVSGNIKQVSNKNINLYYNYGDKDFLVPRINESMRDYSSAGFRIKHSVYPQIEHCRFNTAGEIAKIWRDHLIRPSTQPSPSPNLGAGLPANFVIQLKVNYRAAEDGYQGFQLYLDGDKQSMEQIAKVKYETHSSFGINQFWESADHQHGNGFATVWYTTYASGWKTGQVSVSLKNGKTLTYPGVTIDPKSQTVQPFSVSPQLQLGSQSGGFQQFQLRLAGEEASLKQIKQVKYEIHPTFGENAESLVTEAGNSGDFSSGYYSTYAKNWQTGAIEVTLQSGEVITYPGVLVSW